ncbi:SH3 domain-containing protein [Fennellomyces sp. T-0311]|nr:SH3 domain-containing protein [Fennellomyces sp. T-0311]
MAGDPQFQAQYAYDAQQPDELSLQLGDKVRVLSNDNADWWTVENVDTGSKGMVPSNFLQQVAAANGSPKKAEGSALAKVIRDYEPQNPDELALWVNGIVTVLDQSVADGWWKGDLNGKVGVFPADHVKLVDAAEIESADGADAKTGKNSFKLAAYGVKQGGIGSILAGGMGLRKKGGGRTSIAEDDHAHSEHSHPQPPNVPADKPSNEPASTGHKKGMVLHDYEPQNKDEIKLMRGEYVTVTDKLDDQGWWTGTNEAGASGVFPSNFVQVVEEQRAPPRRTRPPTIKTDTPNQPSESIVSPTSMARPPPVPVSTRPTTLLTNRTSSADSHQNPPARPVTSPPLPTRRPPSAAEPPKRTHKPRTPSIPLVSPDLPPVTSKSQEHSNEPPVPVRPSRPVPTPGDGITSPRSSTVERRSADVAEHRPPIPMAKPPKMFGANKSSGPLPPPRTSSAGSRPSSQAAAAPSVPVTAPPRQVSLPVDPSESKGSDVLASPPPMPRRSMPLPPPSRHDHPLPTPTTLNEEDEDEIDPAISKLLQREMDKLRVEFESLLEIERAERHQLEEEIRELKERRP